SSDLEPPVELRVVFRDESAHDLVDVGEGHSDARPKHGRIDIGMESPFAIERAEDEFYVAMAEPHFLGVRDEIVGKLQPIDQPFRYADREVDLTNVGFLPDDNLDRNGFLHGSRIISRP